MQTKLLTDNFEDFSTRLDWRWARVQALFSDEASPVTGFDDAITVRALRFMQAFQDTANMSERQLLRMKYPHEIRAYDYFLNGDMRRLKVESMCLCEDLSKQQIASILDEPVEVIELFEDFFFDVRKRKREAVFNNLFPPGVFEEALGTNLSDKVWKFIAMVAGFKVLQCLINPAILSTASDEFFSNLSKRSLIKNNGIAELVRPLSHRGDIMATSEALSRMVELDIKERDASGGIGLPDAQALILQKCMEATHVQVMDPDYKIESPFEPTVEQLLTYSEPLQVPAAV